MASLEHSADFDLFASFSESLLKKDLSTDTEFLASLLTWNNGHLSTMLYQVVKNIDLEEIMKSEGSSSQRNGQHQVNTQEKSNSGHISTRNTDKASMDSQSSANLDEEESKNGVLPTTKKTLVGTSNSISDISKKSKSKENKPRKRNRRQRMDVVFKTVLRAIRRYYTKIFKTTFPQTRRLSQRPTILTQLNIMKSFVKEVFQLKKDNNELVFFVMGLINNKLFDSCIRAGYVPPKLGKEVTEMFECTYNFKMGKFKNVSSYPSVQQMLANMLKSGVDQIISQEKTMAENPDLYKEAFQQFINAGQ
ncbi:unnamed protein product [Moneuplotes crassus]|uniref:Uncharacterized protein n=1 Tax=Euplotes crassus TaxID=5936 RepID=A0AAD1XIC5_EUPCR|nr:unnamed protein product [Moneuplotes crassus]